MAAASLDPTVLSLSTRFAPAHRRTHSRSPSRSPTRKAQFAARELDPLLKNLSPDSTLQALQKTDTITTKEAEQNALARSISDASTSEREIGVRAALAAKKLREWQKEVSAWSWPSARDITWGAGFIPPAQTGALTYYGSLPETSLAHYDERLEEIWDAIETLGLDEIKDYVFSSHVSPTPSERATSPSSPLGYGRMRDFTALITATVIQALPDLAHLYVLLETWSIRLNVCREIPELLKTIEASKAGVQIASEIIRSPQTGPLVTAEELETTQTILDGNVAALGKRVDNLLDQLEGQQDVLPQAWIDAVEDLERRYADWVVEAKQLVLRNEAAQLNPQQPEISPAAALDSIPVERETATQAAPVVPATLNKNAAATSSVKRKALHPIEPNKGRGHIRGVSEVSVADSILSGYSGDNAEIVEAKPASLLPSPKVSVIDPFSGKMGESWLAAAPAAGTSPKRPFLLQRASTASIEVVPKASIKEVNLRRTASHDMLREMRESPPGTPRRTLKKLTGMETPQTSPLREQNASLVEDSNQLPATPGASAPILAAPSDSVAVLDHEPTDVDPVMPPLPRRSSKRLSYTISHPSRPTTPADKLTTEHAIVEDDPSITAVRHPVTPPTKIRANETLDDKIRGILTSLPAKIRMTEDSDSAESSNASESSTRENSPAPALKLSPVKDRSRHGNSTSAIRVYHLSRSGKGRDGAPIKLFVRAVGENGERVMVRVGGGWADLKEYLREYSLHHGGRGIDESKLEVANFPRKTRSQLLAGKVAEISARSVTPVELEGRVSSSNTGFDFGPLVDLTRVRTASPQPLDLDEDYSAPTASRQPKTYTMDAPTMITRTSSDGDNLTNMYKPPEFDQTNRPQPQPVQDPDVPQTMTNNLVSGNVSTSTTMSTAPLPSLMYTPYTPLGAAGPVQSGRRVAPQAMTRYPPNQTTGQASRPRAVSGQNISVVHGPTTTTTTMVTSRSTPNKARRIVSASATPTPVSTAATGRATPTPLTALPAGRTTPTTLTALPTDRTTPMQSPLGSLTSNTAKTSQRPLANVSRSSTPDSAKGTKSKMHLSDVSGIKRVFLRRKNSK